MIILFIAYLPILICSNFVYPYKRGFYCDDDSIYYPFKHSTVTSFNLYVFGLAIPILAILIIEAYRTYVFEPRFASKPCVPKISLLGRACHPYATRLYFYIGYFLFGAALCQSLSNVAKYSVGRLRPHFMSICKPSFNVSSCIGHAYIEEPHCMGDYRKVREGRLSFPSGHSSFAFYTMMFAVFYIQAQVIWPTVGRLLKPLVQFALICLAVATALSRISNYKHHWSDVLAGSILGISCATVMTFTVMGLFRFPKQSVVYRGISARNVKQLGEMINQDAVLSL